MDLTFGRDGAIGAGEESAWGTAVSRTNWWSLIRCTLARKLDKQRRPNLKSGSGGANTRGHTVPSDNVEGEVEVEICFEGFGMWLKHALGDDPSTTGTDPYTHTYLMAAQLPVGLTLERILGRDADGTLQAEVFEGCKINSAKWSWSAGDGPGRAVFGIIGETSAGRTTGGTPTFTTNDVPVEDKHGGTFTFDGVTYTPESVEVSLENNLTRRRRMGSALTAEPQRNGMVTAKIRVVAELDANDAHAAYLADTQGDVAITFTSGSRQFNITGHNGYITAYDDPTSDAGIIKRTFEFECESDGTDEGLKFVVVNTQATATAA